MTAARKGRLALAALLVAAIPAAVEAARPLPAPAVDPSTGIHIFLASDFWEPPLSVALPLRAQIRNDSARPRTLELVFTARAGTRGWGSTCLSRHPLRVEPWATAELQIVVPLCPRESSGMALMSQVAASVRGDVSAPEVPVSSRFVVPLSNRTPSPAVAMSEGLARRNWAPLQAALESAGLEFIGSRFATTELPADWRGWGSFAAVLMTGDEWRGLHADARAALLEWTAAGGTLLLAGDVAEERWRGLGSIRSLPATGTDLDLPSAVAAVRALRDAPLDRLPSYAEAPIVKRLGERRTPRRPLALVMLGYAFAVGPLNLWLFRGRRHHVFWTTPAVAACACLLLGAVILFRDGIGGVGWRHTTVLLLPDEDRAVVLQEQAVRTGVMVAGGFSAREPLLMMPLPRADTRLPARLEFSSERFSGDWLVSRSVQGQILQSMRPSRARVTLTGLASGRAAVSTFPATLDALHVIDADGSCWTTRGPIHPGVAVPLVPAPRGAFETWWLNRLQTAGPRARDLVQRLGPRPGWFYASAPVARSAPLATSPAVRWQDDPLLLLGPVG